MIEKKTVLVSLALMFIALFPVWGGGNQSRNTASAGTGSTSLRGTNVTIGNWWGDYNVNTVVPANENAERVLAWRKRILSEHNFNMEVKNIAGFGEMAQLAVTSIMAGDPAASIFILAPAWAMALIRQGLIYPVTDNTAVNLRNPQPVQSGVRAPEWNQSTLDAFSINGKSYAFSVGIDMSTTVLLFYNKRLFMEAGLDPELPYNMQRDGTWTWDAFLNISRRLTRDINNDGIIDTYAMPRDFSVPILDAVLASNGARLIDRDSTGRFVIGANRAEFMEGLQFAIRLNNEGIMKPKPDDTNWDWFKAEFIDGNVAMRIEDSYIWGELQNMRDDWGVVFFPKGPRSSTYRMYTHANVMVVPATFNAEQVNNIMYAVALWETPQTDDWKTGYWNTFRDTRAVNETLTMMRDQNIHLMRNYMLIPDFNPGDIAWSMWSYQGDPAQLVESVSPNWNVLLTEVNNDLFR